MGAKAPSKLKLRRPTYKCKTCSKKFLSAQALKTHLFCEHKLNRTKRSTNETNKITSTSKTPATGSEHSSAPANSVIQKEQTSQPQVSSVTHRITPTNSDSIKITYACSKCKRMLATSKAIQKHIEQVHTAIGGKKSSSETEEIKVETVALCMICFTHVEEDKPHMCTTSVLDLSYIQLFLCTGCNQKFKSVQHFDMHVSGLHGEAIESFFFPSFTEFNEWKSTMERSTLVRYSALSCNKSKQTYRCMFLPTNDVTAVYFCPSSIMIREYSKGLQVHFYQQHHGHPFCEYTTPKQYMKYTLKMSLLKPHMDIDDIIEDKDLYVQFRNLMNFIVVDSAKINIEMLKVLVSKALEMTAILNTYNEDESDISPTRVLSRSMTDEEIFKALKFFMEKQKNNSSTNSDTPKILNTFSLAGNSEVNTEPNIDIPQTVAPPKTTSPKMLRKSVRFRDTPTKVVESVDKKLLSASVVVVNTSRRLPMPILSHSNQSIATKHCVGTPAKDVTPTPTVTTVASISNINQSVDHTRPIRGVGIPTKDVAAPTPTPTTAASVLNINRNVATRPLRAVGTPIKHIASPTTPTTVASPTAVTKTPEPPPTITQKGEPKPLQPVKKGSTASQLASFNDSYKDFVDKNFKLNVKKPNDTNQPVSDVTNRPEYVASNANVVSNPRDVNKLNVKRMVMTKPKPAEIVLQHENIVVSKKNVARNENVNGARAVRGESIRKTLMRKIRKRGRKKKVKFAARKGVVKTKIGQYKPIVSPKTPVADLATPKPSAPTPSISKKKVKHVKYEVKEQDNDCNILILKI